MGVYDKMQLYRSLILSDLEQIQHKLLTTPTGGVAGEHSAWYRRLLSAGYKGHIQGAIGGAALYGTLGLAVGTLVGVAAAPFTAGQSLWLIPASSGIGVLFGAETFANIGTTAAIIAEDSELSEKRRTLLDRYYDDSTGEAERAEIQKQLQGTTSTKKPEQLFHMKTVLVGAAIGAAVAVGLTALALSGVSIPFLLTPIAEIFHLHVGMSLLGALAPVAAITGLGAAAGGMIGIDREYVRRWIDGAESIVVEPHRAAQEVAERKQEVNQITKAAKHDERNAKTIKVEQVAPAPAPITGSPTTHVSAIDLQNRMGDLGQSVQVPSV